MSQFFFLLGGLVYCLFRRQPLGRRRDELISHLKKKKKSHLNPARINLSLNLIAAVQYQHSQSTPPRLLQTLWAYLSVVTASSRWLMSSVNIDTMQKQKKSRKKGMYWEDAAAVPSAAGWVTSSFRRVPFTLCSSWPQFRFVFCFFYMSWEAIDEHSFFSPRADTWMKWSEGMEAMPHSESESRGCISGLHQIQTSSVQWVKKTKKNKIKEACLTMYFRFRATLSAGLPLIWCYLKALWFWMMAATVSSSKFLIALCIFVYTTSQTFGHTLWV